jgi:hypothetical protein
MLSSLTKNISKYFFLIIFLIFFSNITFFSHEHIVDGYIIVHSHPFKHDKNGVPVHQHTAKGYLLIHFLADFLAFALSITGIRQLIRLISEKLIQIFSSDLQVNYLFIPNALRGPPQIMLF